MGIICCSRLAKLELGAYPACSRIAISVVLLCNHLFADISPLLCLSISQVVFSKNKCQASVPGTKTEFKCKLNKPQLKIANECKSEHIPVCVQSRKE
jgi:hypothetical protein